MRSKQAIKQSFLLHGKLCRSIKALLKRVIIYRLMKWLEMQAEVWWPRSFHVNHLLNRVCPILIKLSDFGNVV
jgi:hypothetical protein